MAEHYDPSIPSEERRQFAEWFAVCFQAVDSNGKFNFDKAVADLEALRAWPTAQASPERC